MVTIVIPARYQSQRFEGKPMAMLRGASGSKKSLIQRSWEAGCAVPEAARVIVATDDERIAEHARGFGAEVMMTSPKAANGTERCAEVAKSLPEAELIVNLQGDAPLTPPDFVSAVIGAMGGADMATPVLRADAKPWAACKRTVRKAWSAVPRRCLITKATRFTFPKRCCRFPMRSDHLTRFSTMSGSMLIAPRPCAAMHSGLWGGWSGSRAWSSFDFWKMAHRCNVLRSARETVYSGK